MLNCFAQNIDQSFSQESQTDGPMNQTPKFTKATKGKAYVGQNQAIIHSDAEEKKVEQLLSQSKRGAASSFSFQNFANKRGFTEKLLQKSAGDQSVLRDARSLLEQERT